VRTLSSLYDALEPGGVIVVVDDVTPHFRWDGAHEAYAEFCTARADYLTRASALRGRCSVADRLHRTEADDIVVLARSATIVFTCRWLTPRNVTSDGNAASNARQGSQSRGITIASGVGIRCWRS
jgi:hypothetical protein